MDNKKKSANNKKSQKKKQSAKFLRDDNNIPDEAGKKEDLDTTSLHDAKVSDDPRVKWSMNIIANKTYRVITKEFISNKKIKPATFTTEAYDKNDAKNRYNDIVCIDATRVVLKDREDDYIHASWMNMQDGQKYICTQGPIMETLEDFWHMIVQEKSPVIIMLCNLNEGKNEKCARYYPKEKGATEEFGPFKVTLKEKKTDPFENIQHQILQVEFNDKKQTVHHLANFTWPDHTAPEKATATVGLYRLSKKLSVGHVITVHCSAGIGRTATFVGIDYATQKIQKDPDASMVEVLKDLRGMRFHAIQSAIQYTFLHMCILEMYAEDGIFPRKGKYEKYCSDYQAMVKRYALKMAASIEKGE